MSAHVLLNLLNKFGKRDKMGGLSSIFSLFCNEFNKFNNTGIRMLESIKFTVQTLKSHFCVKTVLPYNISHFVIGLSKSIISRLAIS